MKGRGDDGGCPGSPKNVGTDLMLLKTKQREAGPTKGTGYNRLFGFA